MAPEANVPARPPRVPKLTYRNRLPPDQSSLSSSLNTTAATPTATDTFEHCLPTPASPAAPSFDSRSTHSSNSLASSNGSTSKDSSKAPKKKKKNGVLSFLTLKEPSQLALEQYAESQRKQAAAKGGSVNTVGLQGISPQKLPANVPKVNSKWDGVPQSVKSSRSSMTSTSSSKRNSSSSHESRPQASYGYSTSTFSVATEISRGAPNTLASAASSSTDITERRDSGSSVTPPLSSPSTSSLPEITYFFPDNPDSTGALPRTPTQIAPSYPWSPPPQPPPASVEPTTHPVSTSIEPVPADHDLYYPVVDSKAEAIFRRLNASSGRAFLAGEAREVKLEQEEDDHDFVPESHDFLFEKPTTEHPIVRHPPTTFTPPPADSAARRHTNFSRPRQAAHSSHKPVSALPTLYEASIASTDTIADLPALTKSPTQDSDAASIAPSIAPSFTPSEMSASWYRSPRERLGLGGRLRKNDVSPWESQEEPPGKKKGRLSVFIRNS